MATSTDTSYDNGPVVTFSVVEINVALISACLPTLKPLLANWTSGLSSNSRGTYGSSGRRATHGIKQSSVMPSIGGYDTQLNSLSTKRGAERLDAESDTDGKIRVVTRVDVKVHDKDGSARGGRESSTESLFRDAKHIV